GRLRALPADRGRGDLGVLGSGPVGLVPADGAEVPPARGWVAGRLSVTRLLEGGNNTMAAPTLPERQLTASTPRSGSTGTHRRWRGDRRGTARLRGRCSRSPARRSHSAA